VVVVIIIFNSNSKYSICDMDD